MVVCDQKTIERYDEAAMRYPGHAVARWSRITVTFIQCQSPSDVCTYWIEQLDPGRLENCLKSLECCGSRCGIMVQITVIELGFYNRGVVYSVLHHPPSPLSTSHRHGHDKCHWRQQEKITSCVDKFILSPWILVHTNTSCCNGLSVQPATVYLQSECNDTGAFRPHNVWYRGLYLGHIMYDTGTFRSHNVWYRGLYLDHIMYNTGAFI